MTEVLLASLILSLTVLLILSLRVGSPGAAAERRALARAGEALEAWKQRELSTLRADLYDIARAQALVELESWKADFEKAVRLDAIRRSEYVSRGKVSEHFLPYLPDFEFNPRDARFLGSPVDFVVFDGLAEGEVREVVFIEVKTGRSALTGRERRVRDAVEAGRVRWCELRPGAGLST